MKPFKIFIALCILTAFSFSSAHKYYLSLTQINYVEESQTLQITSELFIDDLEKVLKKRYSEVIALIENKTSEASKEYISRYLNDKLIIQVDGEKVIPKFLGIEYKEDKIVCYLEATNVAKFSTFDVSNTVLLDMFSKQQNVVKLKIRDVEKSVLLVKDKKSAQILL